MTRVRYEREDYCIKIEGHAGYAPKGEDIVCSALSILIMTLERRLLDTERIMTAVHRSPGKISVRAVPARGWERQCRECFDTVFTGFRLLAESMGEYVQAQEI